MEEFNTENAMREIRESISVNHCSPGDLSFTTFYYRKLIEILKDTDELILFGAGRYGQIMFMALMQEGIRTVSCFCDNSDQVIGSFVCGVEVLSPQDAIQRYPNACFVITPKDYDNEILRQLVHAGVDIDNIVICNIKNTGMVVE